MRKEALIAFIAATLLGWGVASSRAEARISLEKCTLCHGKTEFRKILVDGKIRELFATADSLKGRCTKKTCVDCHFDVSEMSAPGRPRRVICTHCHYKGTRRSAPVGRLPCLHRFRARKGDRQGKREGPPVPGLPRKPLDPEG